MNSKYTKLFSNTIIFAIGSIGTKLITFFLVPLYTNVLSVEEYGIADLIITVSNILVPIFGIVIQDSLLRFGLSKDCDNGAVLKNAYFVLLIGIALSFCTIPIINLYQSLSNWSIYIVLVAISVMIDNICFTYAKVKNKNIQYSIFSIIQTILVAVFAVVFLFVLNYGILGYILAILIGNTIPAILLVFTTDSINDLRHAHFDKVLLKQMLIYSLPLIINNLSWWILSSSDKIMIEIYVGASSLGLYTAATKIPTLLSVFTTIFTQAWTISSIKEYDSEKENTFFSNVFNVFSMLLFLSMAIIVLILKPFMSIYVSDDFYSAWKMVPLLLFGMVFYSISAFFGAIYAALKKNLACSASTIIAAIINIIINLCLLKTIGVFAAVISTAVSYFIISIFRMFHSRKYLVFKLHYFKLIFSTVVIFVMCILVYFDFNIYIVSSVSLFVLLILYFSDIRQNIIKLKGLFVKNKKSSETLE